jgi:tetratricopeptide (TPR) repeat protein
MFRIIGRCHTEAHRYRIAEDSGLRRWADFVTVAGILAWIRASMTTIARPAPWHASCAVFVTMALQTGMLAAQQQSGLPDTRSAVEGLASQGQFQAADQVIELELTGQQPDYDLFHDYLSYLVNETDEAARAARLGEKWLPAIRKDRPQALGRILKETALGILFGRFRQTHSSDDYIAAKGLLEEAIEENPQVMEAYLHLAFLASLEGRAAASVSLLGRAVETATDRAQREQIASVRDRAQEDEKYLLAIARHMYSIEK